jgi:hypothetical protein
VKEKLIQGLAPEVYFAKFRPVDERELVVEVRTATDELGRARFVAHRLGYNPSTGEARGHRVQVFHASVAEFVAQATGRHGSPAARISRVRLVPFAADERPPR